MTPTMRQYRIGNGKHLYYATVLSLLPVLLPLAVQAKLNSAAWGTEPAAPVYAGQIYDLTLTLETDKDEEITGFNLDQGPKRAPDGQETTTVANHRRTVFRWQMTNDRAKLAAIPEARLIATVTTVRTFGFMRSSSANQQGVMVPAFNYEIADLPGDAKGTPIGTFALGLKADAATFAPGEVRMLTATLQATEGRVPEAFAFVLEGTPEGQCYPFRVIERTPTRLVAQAYFVAEADHNLTLRLAPLKAFDLKSRALATVTCPPLTLQMRPETEAAESENGIITIGTETATHGQPLRFAPTDSAPVIGTLGGTWTIDETRGDWSRIGGADVGWIRTAHLKGTGR